jgi:hypothetical protein
MLVETQTIFKKDSLLHMFDTYNESKLQNVHTQITCGVTLHNIEPRNT